MASERFRSIFLSWWLVAVLGATGCQRWAGDYAGTSIIAPGYSVSGEVSLAGPDTALQLQAAHFTYRSPTPQFDLIDLRIAPPCAMKFDASGYQLGTLSCPLDPSSVYGTLPLPDGTTVDLVLAQWVPGSGLAPVEQIYWQVLDLSGRNLLAGYPYLYLDRVVPPGATTDSTPPG